MTSSTGNSPADPYEETQYALPAVSFSGPSSAQPVSSSVPQRDSSFKERKPTPVILASLGLLGIVATCVGATATSCHGEWVDKLEASVISEGAPSAVPVLAGSIRGPLSEKQTEYARFASTLPNKHAPSASAPPMDPMCLIARYPKQGQTASFAVLEALVQAKREKLAGEGKLPLSGKDLYQNPEIVAERNSIIKNCGIK